MVHVLAGPQHRPEALSRKLSGYVGTPIIVWPSLTDLRARLEVLAAALGGLLGLCGSRGVLVFQIIEIGLAIAAPHGADVEHDEIRLFMV